MPYLTTRAGVAPKPLPPPGAGAAGRAASESAAAVASAQARGVGGWNNPPNPQDTGSGWLSGPGAGEQFFGDTRGFYSRPTQSNQYFQSNQGFFNQPGAANRMFDTEGSAFFTPGSGEKLAGWMARPMMQQGMGQQNASNIIGQTGGQVGGANQAQQAWDAFNRNRPNISADAGLDPYYQNAKRRASEDIRQNMASAGAYGSSATADQTAEAMTNLNAEQANRESQYNLQRLAEQRGWEGLGGQLAGQASNAQLGWATGMGNLGLGAEGMDLNRQQAGVNAALAGQGMGLNRLGQGFGVASGMDQMDLARILGGGTLAGNADVNDLNRIIGGQNAALGAQGAQAQRGQNYFNNLLNFGIGTSGVAQPAFENLFTSDQQYRDAASAAGLGLGNEAIRGERAAGEAFWNDYNAPMQGASNTMSTIYGFGGMGGGGMGGGGGGQQTGGSGFIQPQGYGQTGLINPWG